MLINVNLRGCLHETRNEIQLKWNFVPSWKKSDNITFHSWQNEIKFCSAGWSQWNDRLKYVNKPEQDIETSMLKKTIRALIKEILCWIKKATNQNSKLWKIWHITCIQWNSCCMFQINVNDSEQLLRH